MRCAEKQDPLGAVGDVCKLASLVVGDPKGLSTGVSPQKDQFMVTCRPCMCDKRKLMVGVTSLTLQVLVGKVWMEGVRAQSRAAWAGIMDGKTRKSPMQGKSRPGY